MGKIGLSEGFWVMGKGSDVLEIVKVKYKEDFGKMEVRMEVGWGEKEVEGLCVVECKGEGKEGGLKGLR